MKNDKKFRIGRISLQVDMQNGKILNIVMHDQSEYKSKKAPQDIIRAGELLNGGYTGKALELTPDDLALEIMKPFQREILLCLYRNVPAGKVITYGKLADLAGYPGAARAVGTAMSSNPFPMLLPCHRVVPASGFIGRFGGGPATKLELLKAEGIGIDRSGKIKSKHYV